MKPMTKELFWELLEPEHKQAERFCRKLCGSKDDGDDLYQEALLAAYQGIESLRNKLAFKSWLYRIIITRHRNMVRQPWWKRRTTLTARHGDIKNFDPSEQFTTRRWLLRAFEALKAEERALIVLFEIEGWTVTELAGLLNKPEGTIKARLSRSRKKMRKAIIAYLPDRDKKSQTSEAGYALSKSTAINE